MRQIWLGVNHTVTGFERPFRIVNNAAGVWFSVHGFLGLWTYWALFPAPPASISILVQCPRYPKHIDIICVSAVGKIEVVFGIVVVVAAETAHLLLVCRGHDHLNIIDGIVEDFEPKVCLDNYVSALLGDLHAPITEGERKVHEFIIQLERKENYCKVTVRQGQQEDVDAS